jgi:hypothetical protein
MLGVSQTTGTLPLRILWFATTNNAVLGADTTRRTVQIRLQSDREKPEERTGFAHPDIVEWVHDNRAGLVVAALTIARAYFVAGRPRMNLPAMGSFEGWGLVREMVVWVGLPDPLRTQVALAETGDREVAELRGLIDGIRVGTDKKGRPMSARELIDFAASDAAGQALKDLLLEYLPGRAGNLPTPARLSGRLRHLKGRVSGTSSIHPEPGRSGASRWGVREARGGDGGHGGVSTAIPRASARESESVSTVTTQPTQPTQPSPGELGEPGHAPSPVAQTSWAGRGCSCGSTAYLDYDGGTRICACGREVAT